jgi:hypothetical protein
MLRAEGVCTVYAGRDVFGRVDGLPSISLLLFEVTAIGHHPAGIRVASDTIRVLSGLATNMSVPTVIMPGEAGRQMYSHRLCHDLHCRTLSIHRIGQVIILKMTNRCITFRLFRVETAAAGPLCDSLCDPRGHTNQIEPELIKTLNVNGFEKPLSGRQNAKEKGGTDEEFRIELLVLEMLDVCRDQHSRAFYRLVARQIPEELIRAVLSETRYQDGMGRITKSRGAFFTDQLRRLAKDRGINLEFKLHSLYPKKFCPLKPP